MKKRMVIGSPEFLALQKRWYDRLEKEGFHDIERYGDMREHMGSKCETTQQHVLGAGAINYQAVGDGAEPGDVAGTRNIWNHPRAVYWRTLERYAEAYLDDWAYADGLADDVRRAIVMRIVDAQDNVQIAAAMIGVTPKRVSYQARKLRAFALASMRRDMDRGNDDGC